jgi:hypothetical protein
MPWVPRGSRDTVNNSRAARFADNADELARGVAGVINDVREFVPADTRHLATLPPIERETVSDVGPLDPRCPATIRRLKHRNGSGRRDLLGR